MRQYGWERPASVWESRIVPEDHYETAFRNQCGVEMDRRDPAFIAYLEYLRDCNGGEDDKKQMAAGEPMLKLYMAFRRYTLTDMERREIEDDALEMEQDQ